MADWLLVLIIFFSHLLVGAIVACVWEKIEWVRLRYGHLKPWLITKYPPDPSWYTCDIAVVAVIIFWPVFVVLWVLYGVYVLIRKIFGL
jgi:hypothetical protein